VSQARNKQEVENKKSTWLAKMWNYWYVEAKGTLEAMPSVAIGSIRESR
jgi:hypothetical protein